MAIEVKNGFDAEKLKQTLRQRVETAFSKTLQSTVADIQIRLDSGRGINGESYSYSKPTAKKKGKFSPVDWSDTGTLRRSIDFSIDSDNDKLAGRIGVKDVKRGKASNKVILQSLINRFPSLWGLSKQEIANIYTNFVKYFKS